MNSCNLPFKLLICDLDNTLYNWVAYFVPSFYAMVDKAVELLDCNRDTLLDDFREVHQRYHDSEHPFSLLETRTVQDRFRGLERREIARRLDDAFHAFNSSRTKTLTLNPGVKKALELIRERGIRLIAHTDSQLFGAADRLKRLGLTHFFSKIYCRERPKANHPDPETGKNWLDHFPMDKVHELSKHQLKPEPTILAEIYSAEGFGAHEVAYVGDSIARDILMAKKAGVFGIWAKYGAILNTSDYEKLVRITHWTKKDVERERRLKKEAENIRPDLIIWESFDELLPALFPGEIKKEVVSKPPVP